MSPIGEKLQKPLNEAQVRELVQVPSDKRVEFWTKSVEAAGEGSVTARVVRSFAKELRPASKPASTKEAAKRQYPTTKAETVIWQFLRR